MAVCASNLTKHYPHFTLDDITFDIPQGYITGLIGPNGAGKSTIIKLLLNMVHRDSGDLEILGKDAVADEEAIKQQLGVVLDSNVLYPQWRVKDAEYAIGRLYDNWNHTLFEEYADRFNLDRTKRVKQLSRGMQIKLHLALALSHDAKLLILDEPTSGLDVIARDELMDIFRDYVSDGEHTVLFSTHITSDLEHTADFIVYITHGQLFYTGPKDEFEDSFTLVQGGPADLSPQIRREAVGLDLHSTGFYAMLRIQDAHAMKIMEDPSLIVEKPSIEDILRFTNLKRPPATTGSGTSDIPGISDVASGSSVSNISTASASVSEGNSQGGIR